jgi:hypothetical protein
VGPSAREFLREFWFAVRSQHTTRINELLLSDAFPTLLHPGFDAIASGVDAIHTHHEPAFRWPQLQLRVSSMIAQGFELTHDIVDGRMHNFYVERCGFWAESAEHDAGARHGRHQIMFMFCWQPRTDPYPQSMQIRYIGPQRFQTFDNEIGRLMQENMQGPHSR